MRVLHVITALGVGGAERMLLKLLGARALGHVQQRVVAMLPGGALAQSMRATGARVDELDFLGPLAVLRGSAQLARQARQFAPDLVQGWLYHGNLGAALARAALPRRVPLVWGIRQSLASLEGENVFARIGILLGRFGSGQPDRLLFNSQTSMAQHRAFGFHMDHAQYIPNGFEAQAFRPDAAARLRWRSEWGVGEGTVAYGMFARYHPSKDHAGFLRAAARVHADRPQTCFILAGTGVDQDNADLTRSIHEAGLQGKVHLLGERSDVPALLAALDVYVSSSAWIEAFSNSVGEAMSCGVPCIVTDIGDSPGIVGRTGRVVPPRDPGALAEAMTSLADLDVAGRHFLGEEARARVIAEFDIEAVAGRYAALYGELVSSAAAAR